MKSRKEKSLKSERNRLKTNKRIIIIGMDFNWYSKTIFDTFVSTNKENDKKRFLYIDFTDFIGVTSNRSLL